jgi:cytochrome c biogenesis protein CcdA
MGTALIYSTSILTAFFGGVLALFAPCCIISLGPTYLAGVMAAPRRRLLDRTGVFAVGVAVILLPIVLGIGGIGVLLNREHAAVFFVGGILMVVMGISALLGKGWTLPLPMMRAPSVSASGPAGMLLLGIFSGVISSCCAPVLGGVLVLSVSAGSIFHAFSLGVAYVVGMVFPLFLAALFWDRLRLAGRGVFKGRTASLRFGGYEIRRRLPDLGAAVLFLGMGSLMIGLAVTGRGTYTPDFLRRLTVWGSARLADLAQSLSGIPEWVIGAGLIALIAGMLALAWPRENVEDTRDVVEQESPRLRTGHSPVSDREAEPITH